MARWQAADDGYLTSRHHIGYTFPDALERTLVARLDGTLGRDDLIGIDGAEADQVDDLLGRLAGLAFLEPN